MLPRSPFPVPRSPLGRACLLWLGLLVLSCALYAGSAHAMIPWYAQDYACDTRAYPELVDLIQDNAVVFIENAAGSVGDAGTFDSPGQPAAGFYVNFVGLWYDGASLFPAASDAPHQEELFYHSADPSFYFVSGDGQKWFKVASRYRLLVQPVLRARDMTVVALSQPHPDVTETTPAVKSASLLAYPNPFNPEVKLDLYLPHAELVTAKIYDVRGRVVRRLLSEQLDKGTTSLVWDGRDDSGRQVGSGVYWAQVRMGARNLTRRVVMVK